MTSWFKLSIFVEILGITLILSSLVVGMGCQAFDVDFSTMHNITLKIISLGSALTCAGLCSMFLSVWYHDFWKK